MKQPHIPVLKCFEELKFNLGKKTLICFLKGDPHPTIDSKRLDKLDSYGSLYMLSREEIEDVIDWMQNKGLLYQNLINGKFRVLERAAKGKKEYFERKEEWSGEDKNSSINTSKDYSVKESPVREEEKKFIENFSFFLEGYDEAQKRAIVSPDTKILAIAGAGAGKTTVLTKRLEFISKFRGIDGKRILAITFTRKAREEMERRLSQLGVKAQVETFNSFCEKILRNNSTQIYGNKKVQVAEFKDKINLVKEVFNQLEISIEYFYESYFRKKQVMDKSPDELFLSFVSDMFSIIDFYNNRGEEIDEFYEREENPKQKEVAKKVYEIVTRVRKLMRQRGLRDFSDQLTDVVDYFKNNSDQVPYYQHVLVDEYQDVNYLQKELLSHLSPDNLFVVGDPRQAIYGFRGADVSYILDFAHQDDTTVIYLDKNYRSASKIISFSNKQISPMRLPEMKSYREVEGSINLEGKKNQDEEVERVIENVKESLQKGREIFILARTNRVLDKFEDKMVQEGISYSVQSENSEEVSEKVNVILSTVHSIKGLEADDVYLVSANSLSFPNKVQDNFVFHLVKGRDEEEREEEERRLFYVALTRAKENLQITYTGEVSIYISDEMKSMAALSRGRKRNQSTLLDTSNSSLVLKNMLKKWRRDKAKETGDSLQNILRDETIEKISYLNPSTKEELQSIINASGENFNNEELFDVVIGN